MLLCYVGHHDAAYHSARRRKLDTHPKTGAVQFIEVPDSAGDHHSQIWGGEEASAGPAAVPQLLRRGIADTRMHSTPAWDGRGQISNRTINARKHVTWEQSIATTCLVPATPGYGQALEGRAPTSMPFAEIPPAQPDSSSVVAIGHG
jgi:hypothetical protein